MRGLPREKALATVVHLLEITFIRVGNDDYARQNNTYGPTTLKSRHAAIDGNEVRFRFTGKSGKQRSSHVKNRRVAKIIRACQELPGQDLLDLDKAGNSQNVSSSGNSPTICRKCYLHPEGLSSDMDGNLMLEIKSEVDSESRESLVGLKPEERKCMSQSQTDLWIDVEESEASVRHSDCTG